MKGKNKSLDEIKTCFYQIAFYFEVRKTTVLAVIKRSEYDEFLNSKFLKCFTYCFTDGNSPHKKNPCKIYLQGFKRLTVAVWTGSSPVPKFLGDYGAVF